MLLFSNFPLSPLEENPSSCEFSLGIWKTFQNVFNFGKILGEIPGFECFAFR